MDMPNHAPDKQPTRNGPESRLRKRAPREHVQSISRIRGEVDDVAISGDLFRLEQMSADCWWTAVYRGDERTMFMLKWDRKRRCIVAYLTEDTIGCTGDDRC